MSLKNRVSKLELEIGDNTDETKAFFVRIFGSGEITVLKSTDGEVFHRLANESESEFTVRVQRLMPQPQPTQPGYPAPINTFIQVIEESVK